MSARAREIKVERVERAPDGGFPLLAEREQIESFARAGLEEHDFDLERELGRAYGVAFVARSVSNEPVGLLLGWEVADELHVLSVVVTGEARRMGVGRALMLSGFEHARERTLRLVLLEVARRNLPAIRLYRSLGLVALRVRRAYYQNGDDAVEMGYGLVPGALSALLPDEPVEP